MRYKVKVKIIAECGYEVEVEAGSEGKAEEMAARVWREKTPPDFQISNGCIDRIESEVEQLSWECEGCGKEIAERVYRELGEMCESCAMVARLVK